MMMKRAALVAVSIFGVTAVSIDAQDVLTRSFSVDVAEQTRGTLVGRPGVPDFGLVALDPVSMGGTVIDAPYSAEAVTEVVQALADGNRIEHRNTAMIARDSHGRTRREQQAIAVGPIIAQHGQPLVTITDPASGIHVTLNYETKTAFRSKPLAFKMTDATKIEAAKRSRARDVLAARSAAAQGSSSVTLSPRGSAALEMTRPDEAVVVEVEGPATQAKRVPPPEVAGRTGVAYAAAGSAYAVEGSAHTETLEPRDYEGIRAEGTRTTMTIPAGAMGNVMPIEVVSERWYSPELQIVLMTKRVDPRFGETVYRLTNIERSEPAEDLFKVPSDFEVKEVPEGKIFPFRPDSQ